MISYETHVLPNSDYYVYTPGKKTVFLSNLYRIIPLRKWLPTGAGFLRQLSADVYFKGNLFCNGG